VFRVQGVPRSWRQDLQVLSLWARRDFALSHRTAAALHGFRRFSAGPLEVSATRNLRGPPTITRHVVHRLEARDLASVDGLRVTSVTRTLLDLAAVVTPVDLRATVY
jgi:hypothetical protein